jgi:hypothetical protein
MDVTHDSVYSTTLPEDECGRQLTPNAASRRNILGVPVAGPIVGLERAMPSNVRLLTL